MIKKQNIKRNPQRLKHKVRLDIEFYEDPKNKKIELLIVFIQKGGVSDGKLLLGDIIKSINGIAVNNKEIQFDNEINKINWGDEIILEVERKNKIQNIKIKTLSFENYKKTHAVWGIDIKEEKKQMVIKSYGIEYNYSNYIEPGDILLEINSVKINSLNDLNKEKSKYKVGDTIEFKIERKKISQIKKFKIKLIHFQKAILLNKKSCDNYWIKKAGTLMFKEWVDSDYGYNHKDWLGRREEILKLETIAERFSDARHTENSDYIKDWKNKDAKLLTKLLKPEYRDINFKLNFFSLVFNSKIITKLKSLNLKKECCYSYILTGKVIGGDWDKDVPANIKNFEKLISVKDKKKEIFVDEISDVSLNFFFNEMVDKKKDIFIKYKSDNKFWKFSNKKQTKLSTIQSLGFEDIATNLGYWFESKYKFNKAKVKLAVDDFCRSFFLEYPDFDLERIKEIEKMDLQDEPEYDENDYSSDHQNKIYISTSVSKKKVAGKESFLVKLNNLPTDEEIEDYNIGKKIYLKIYIYDVTDLDEDSFFKIQENGEDTRQYFLNKCHVVKTEDLSWSEGNGILVQTVELKPYEYKPTELAFPYSKLQLPKYGKRKLSFRTFICTDLQKFDENNGRFIFYDSPTYRAEEYFLDSYSEEFDEYGDYTDILSYSSSEIEVEYKQPGYLEINRRKYNDLKIALSLALNQDDKNNQKTNLEKIKDSVRYGDFTVEGNIHKILSLKKNYEKSLNEKLNLDDILKDLKKNSVIHERYEIIDFLLNLATKDETFNSKENKFIDKVSKELQLNQDKYQEIKKQKTSSVKFVDFGEEVEESVFGINKNMTKDEKLKILRKEYSRWNALTNNTDKMIRERAKEMRDLAANLRSQYNK